MSKSHSSLAEWAAALASELEAGRKSFDAATGGAPRLIEGADTARAEAEVLRFKMTWQRNRMREIFKASPVHQDKMDGLTMLDDMLVTAMRLGALELTNDRRDKIERTRKARANGRLRGEQLRAEAEETWRHHALALAQEAQQEDANLVKQSAIIDEITSRWRLKGIKPPKVVTLTRFVRAKQQSGELRGRKKVVS